MTIVQPYPVHRDGSAGLSTAVILPTDDHRNAVAQWCSEHLAGWWRLRKLGMPLRGHSLYEATVALSSIRYRFVVCRA